MRAFIVFVLAVAPALVSAALSGAPGAGVRHGRAAQDVPCGYISERRLIGSTGEERLGVKAEAGGWIEISMSREPGGQASGDLDPLVRLLDAGGAVLAVDDDSGGGRDAFLRFENLPYTGVYTVVATRYSGNGLYRLYVDSSNCGMGGQGGEGNLLCGGGAVTGWLSDSIGNLLDNYSMKAAAGNRLEISVRRDSGDMALSAELLEVRSGDPVMLDQSTVFGDVFASKPAGNSAAVSAAIQRGGNYVLRVYSPAGAEGRYTIACAIGSAAGGGGQPSAVEMARIDWPPDGTVLSGWVDLRGAASMKRFQYYKFEFEDTRCARGVCHVATMRQPVVDGVLMRWDTRSVPNGTYTLKLSVVNQSGIVFRDTPRARITIRN